jgi:hypothetical protein
MTKSISLWYGAKLTANSVLINRETGVTHEVVILTKDWASFNPPLIVRCPSRSWADESGKSSQVPIDMIARNVDEGFWVLGSQHG